MSKAIKTKYWDARLAAQHRSGAWDTVKQGYDEPHRTYHGWGHIGDLLKKLDRFSDLATRADLIAAAIFWHDVVYQTQNSDGSYRPDIVNVRQSAESFLRHSLFAPVETAAVEAMILATGDHMATADSLEPYAGFSSDLDLFLDLDLSGLGASWPKVSRDTQRIRREFAWVAEAAFCTGRAAILRGFVTDGRPLYRRDETNRAWSASARANLTRSIAELEARAVAAGG